MRQSTRPARPSHSSRFSQFTLHHSTPSPPSSPSTPIKREKMTTQEFITQHLDDDIRQLALRHAGRTDIDLTYALDQIAGRQRARTKLPRWAATEGIIYPPHISMEQCSSEQTAMYKAAVVRRLITELPVLPVLPANPLTRLRRRLLIPRAALRQGRLHRTAEPFVRHLAAQHGRAGHQSGRGDLRRLCANNRRNKPCHARLRRPGAPLAVGRTHVRHQRLHARRALDARRIAGKGRLRYAQALAHARLAQGRGRHGHAGGRGAHRVSRQRVQGTAARAIAEVHQNRAHLLR